MAPPIRIAAIDAGSNAIRLVIAEAKSPAEIEVLESLRAPVRLGHRAFTKRQFSRRTMEDAVRAFRHFRALLDRYSVQRYRAVATSAAREARNSDVLLRRIRRSANIELEVIGSSEEARLVRSGILGAVGEKLSPRLIVDLGGGSLEISLLRKRIPERAMALPLGSVRLIETLGIDGAFSENQYERVQHRVSSLFQSFWHNPPDLSNSTAVASGGNAEALARIFPGPKLDGVACANLRLLRERLWNILSLNIDERIRELGVRRERAEVIGVAAIVFAELSRWLRLRSMLVPGVGVKDGILRDLAAAHFSQFSAAAYAVRFQPLLRETRRVALRFHCDAAHAEHVRKLAAILFDELAPVHKLPYELRLPLELAAILHDAGRAINPISFRKHGEYIVRHTPISGLSDDDRALVACLIRFQSNANPDVRHKLYSSLRPRLRKQVCALLAILRIALALDRDRLRAVQHLGALINRKQIRLRLCSSDSAHLHFSDFKRAARLLEQEFGRRVSFGRARASRESQKNSRSRRAA